MLAIAGITAWLGYLVMTYGLSQVGGQNYSIGQLAIPGRFTLGSPPPNSPGAGGGGGNQSPTPCTKAQIAAGYTTDITGNCQPPANPTPGGGPVGWNKCINAAGKVKFVKGNCPNGYTTSGLPGQTGVI